MEKKKKESKGSINTESIISFVLIIIFTVGSAYYHTLQQQQQQQQQQQKSPHAAPSPKGVYPSFPNRVSQPLLTSKEIEIVAELDYPPGNVAVSKDGRVFLTLHPFGAPPTKLIELKGRKEYASYPNEETQKKENGNGLDTPLSIRIDNQNRLWVLDFASDGVNVVKIMAFDLTTDSLAFSHVFPREVAPLGSMLNDFNVSPDGKYVYISDTSIQGNLPSIVILDVENNQSWKKLCNHTSVRADVFTTFANGNPVVEQLMVKVHVDSIALDRKGEWLYYSPIIKDDLYRIPTSVLLDKEMSTLDVEKAVQTFGKKTVSDGISVDSQGNIYLTDYEHFAITVIDQSKKLKTLIQDEKLMRWPDGVGFGPDGYLYVTCSDLHDVVVQSKGYSHLAPFHVLRFKPRLSSTDTPAGQ